MCVSNDVVKGLRPCTCRYSSLGDRTKFALHTGGCSPAVWGSCAAGCSSVLWLLARLQVVTLRPVCTVTSRLFISATWRRTRRPVKPKAPFAPFKVPGLCLPWRRDKCCYCSRRVTIVIGPAPAVQWHPEEGGASAR